MERKKRPRKQKRKLNNIMDYPVFYPHNIVSWNGIITEYEVIEWIADIGEVILYATHEEKIAYIENN